MKSTTILTGAAAALLTAGLGACGAHSAEMAVPTPSVQSPMTPADSVPSGDEPDTTAPSAGTTNHSGATSTSKPPSSTDTFCRADELEPSLVYQGGAAGSTEHALVFTNTGSRACVLQGFPGVSYVAGDDGHQVGKAAFRAGSKGEAFPLAPGQQASALLRMVDVANYDPATCQPTPVRGLRIYPPQSYDSLFLATPNAQGCASESIPGEQLEIQTLHRGVPTGP